MGSLSAIAAYVAAGLQDPVARTDVMRAMKDSTSRNLGLDLQDCGPGGKANSLFVAADRLSAAKATAMCSTVAAMNGLVLYMDRSQLDLWSHSTIPIVTALANPTSARPSHLLGYRSPTRTIDVTGDAGLKGPILVVLPLRHPTRVGAKAAAPAIIIVPPKNP